MSNSVPPPSAGKRRTNRPEQAGARSARTHQRDPRPREEQLAAHASQVSGPAPTAPGARLARVRREGSDPTPTIWSSARRPSARSWACFPTGWSFEGKRVSTSARGRADPAPLRRRRPRPRSSGAATSTGRASSGCRATSSRRSTRQADDLGPAAGTGAWELRPHLRGLGLHPPHGRLDAPGCSSYTACSSRTAC